MTLAPISVGISTRDRPEMVRRCLAHLLSGDVLPAEIIVVDQSQADQTLRVVEAFQPAALALRYIRHAGKGLGRAQNIAFQHARSPVVAVTDDDCVPTPDWVAVIERVFARPGQLDGIAGRVLPFGPEQDGRLAVSSRTSTMRVDFQGKAPPWEVGSGNNFAVKREWLERIGGNDERLGPGAPGQGGVDMDLFYRLLRAGARMRYEPDLLVYHERTDQAGRMARREPYGFGMGACCTLWLRQHDPYAAQLFTRWLLLRTRRLGSGLRAGQWLTVREELLVLRGTFRGLWFGLRANQEDRSVSV